MNRLLANRWWNGLMRGIGLVLSLVVAVMALGGLVPVVSEAAGVPGQAALVAVVVLLLVTRLIIIVVHEGGHALAATAIGWRVPLIAIRGLTIWPGLRRAHLGTRAIESVAGWVWSIPPSEDEWRAGQVIFSLGGPLANIALALIAIALAATVVHVPLWHRYLALAGLYSGVVGFANLLPFTLPGGILNDGARVLKAAFDRTFVFYGPEERLSEEIILRKPPRAWNAELVRKVVADLADGKGTGLGDLQIYSLEFDRGRLPEAKAALERALARLPRRDILDVEKALVLAYIDRDAAAAKQLLSKLAFRSVGKLGSYWCAMGMTEILEGDPVQARLSFERAYMWFKRAPFTTVADYDLLRSLESQLPAAP